MNAWRWIGMVLMVAALTIFGVTASGQQQGTKKATTKAETAKKTTTTAKTTATTKKATTAKTTAKTTEKTTAKTTEKKSTTAGGAGELTPKALEGTKTFYQTLTTTTTQNMTVSGMKHKQEQKQTFYFSWAPKGAKDHQYTVVQKILGVKMDIDIAGNKISFDSTAQNQAKNPMSEFFNQLKGTEFTLTISKDKDGRYVVESVKGVDDLVNKLGKVNQAMVPLLHKILNENTVKQMAEPMLGVIPPGGNLPKDGTWKNVNTLNMGPIGTYKTTNEYTAEKKGEEKGLLPIQVKTKLEYTKPGDQEKGALPFRIVAATLQSKDSGGTIWWNLKKGRVEKANLNVKLDGNLKIDIANMETLVDLNQTQVSRLETTDEEPDAVKKK